MDFLRHFIRLIPGLFIFFIFGLFQTGITQPVISPDKALTSYLIESWKVDEGLPQNTIKAIAQTNDTYLWMTTHEGLVRFNGIDFKVYDSQSDVAIQADSFHPLLVGSDGTIWTGTNGAGVYSYSDGIFTQYSTREGLPFNFIRELAEMPDGTILVGTLGGGMAMIKESGVTVINAKNGLPSDLIYTIFPMNEQEIWIGTAEGLAVLMDGSVVAHPVSSRLKGKFINSILPRKDGSIWISTSTGVHVFQNNSETIHLTTKNGLLSNAVTTLFEDSGGAIWMGTTGGVNRYYKGKIESLTQENGLSHNNIWTFHQDHEGNIWIGTTNGLNRLSNRRFAALTISSGLTNDFIRAIYEDRNQKVWIGTDGGGLNIYDNGKITVYNRDKGLADNRVFSFFEEPDGTMWVGTGGGVTRFKNGSLKTWGRNRENTSGVVMGIAAGPDGAIYLGTAGNGVLRFDGTHFHEMPFSKSKTSNFIRVLYLDRKNNFWVGTNGNGLARLENQRLNYNPVSGLDTTLIVYTFYEDSLGYIWAGTNNGLARIHDGKAVILNEKHGLMDNLVLQIIPDNENHLWLTCNKGPYRVSLKELHKVADGLFERVTFRRFDKSDGMRSLQCNGGSYPAGTRRKNGEIWIPTSEGVVIANVNELELNPITPNVLIEEILVDGKAINLKSNFELETGWNRMEIRYVGINYQAPEKVTYRYYLDGFDRDWLDAGSRKSTVFTNLPSGDYVFRVTAANPDGIINPTGAAVSFSVKPTIYESPWFITLSVLAISGLLFVLYKRRIRTVKRNEHRLRKIVKEQTAWLEEEKEKAEQARKDAEYQQAVAEQSARIIEAQNARIMEIDRAKSAFFSNISHEFRTPLTLTIGPLEHAINGGYGPIQPQLAEQMEMMLRNSRRLLRLINQLLDIAKLDSGKTVLKAAPGNFHSFLSELTSAFYSYSNRKNINLTYRSDSEDIPLFFDRDKMDKVFYNLLSNAFKFTHSNGKISITVQSSLNGDKSNLIKVIVRDSGVGIPADDLPHIFERFRQSGNVSISGAAGTGIGLSMVKDFVEIHGGTIEVMSQMNKGTEFTIYLRKGSDHLDPETIVDELPNIPDQMTTEMLKLEMAELEGEESDPEKPESTAGSLPTGQTVLVVDDNKDIRNYIREILKDSFRVIEATNGRDGLTLVKEIKPTLVISDVMMPVLNGYEMTRAIKADPETSAIPVILLTAKATGDMKVEGLESGANDYMYKPFYAKELVARVKNLIQLYEQEEEVKRINAALLKINQDLTDANALKTELLNIAAHDLKNPLQAIIGYSELLQSGSKLDDKQTKKINQIRQAADRMLHQVNEILESASIESGKLQLNKSQFDLRNSLESIIQLSQSIASQKDQLLYWEAGEPIQINGDESRIREIAENLISNAIKYSQPGSLIWVTLWTEDNMALFSVRDEGPGISPDEQQLLFGKFQRLSTKPTGGETSTGLGLSIVKRLVELHGGSIAVKSKPGDGSTFTVSLPIG